MTVIALLSIFGFIVVLALFYLYEWYVKRRNSHKSYTKFTYRWFCQILKFMSFSWFCVMRSAITYSLQANHYIHCKLEGLVFPHLINDCPTFTLTNNYVNTSSFHPSLFVWKQHTIMVKKNTTITFFQARILRAAITSYHATNNAIVVLLSSVWMRSMSQDSVVPDSVENVEPTLTFNQLHEILILCHCHILLYSWYILEFGIVFGMLQVDFRLFYWYVIIYTTCCIFIMDIIDSLEMLHNVFYDIILSKLVYDISAWYDFCS